MDDLCSRCNEPLAGIRTSDSGGFSHPHCYAIAHPPRKAETIRDVVNGMGDPLLARTVLLDFFAGFPEWHEMIITEFNRRIAEIRKMREMSRQVRTFDDVVERPRIELQGRFKEPQGPAPVRTFTPAQIAKLNYRHDGE